MSQTTIAAPTSGKDLFQLLGGSRVLDPDKLAVVSARHPGGAGLPDDARQAADFLVDQGVLTAYQARLLLEGRTRGLVLGKYRLLEKIGGGDSVFLAERLSTRARFALKVLPLDEAAGPAVVERFKREAHALAKLNHPNIVHINDFDAEDGQLYLVMEHLQGVSLADHVARHGPMDPALAANTIFQAFLGLQQIHKAGLVHRDLKPANLMLESSGGVKILDLGLVRFLDDRTESLTMKYESAKMLGAVEYAAPEQALDSHAVDIRADIYSLGAIFYFLLTGRSPINPLRSGRRSSAMNKQSAPALSELRPETPPALVALIDRMTAPDPAARFGSPADVLEALEPWAGDLAVAPSSVAEKRLSGQSRVAVKTRKSDVARALKAEPTSAKSDLATVSDLTTQVLPALQILYPSAPVAPQFDTTPAASRRASTRIWSIALLILFGGILFLLGFWAAQQWRP